MRAVVLADTGPLYAAVDPEDEHHARARRELQQLDRERRDVLVLYPTLLEAYSLIEVVSCGSLYRTCPLPMISYL